MEFVGIHSKWVDVNNFNSCLLFNTNHENRHLSNDCLLLVNIDSFPIMSWSLFTKIQKYYNYYKYPRNTTIVIKKRK